MPLGEGFELKVQNPYIYGTAGSHPEKNVQERRGFIGLRSMVSVDFDSRSYSLKVGEYLKISLK